MSLSNSKPTDVWFGGFEDLVGLTSMLKSVGEGAGMTRKSLGEFVGFLGGMRRDVSVSAAV